MTHLSVVHKQYDCSKERRKTGKLLEDSEERWPTEHSFGLNTHIGIQFLLKMTKIIV